MSTPIVSRCRLADVELCERNPDAQLCMLQPGMMHCLCHPSHHHEPALRIADLFVDAEGQIVWAALSPDGSRVTSYHTLVGVNAANEPLQLKPATLALRSGGAAYDVEDLDARRWQLRGVALLAAGACGDEFVRLVSPEQT